jgi:glycosyltransferase involved in cell wall biosynthesis
VGERFWNRLAAAIEERGRTAASVASRKKPVLAFLSPYPPDQSGIAYYTALTIQGGQKLFCSDLYSDAPRPLAFEGNFRDAGGISAAALLDGRTNAIISVLGNSSYHTRTFEFFERYGGPCILHDSRLTHVYFARLGEERFLALASKLLGRAVAIEEVRAWLEDRNPPSLFIEPIIERAAPLIVHTVTQQALLKRRYGVDAQVAPCCPTLFFRDDELTTAAKDAARERLGIKPGIFAVSSFGYVGRTKGMEACVLALELLRSWRIPAELYFVGDAGYEKKNLERIVDLYGVTEQVHYGFDFVDGAKYRDFLVASDAAVQLRAYGLGQLSAALTDCISAGLPIVASSDLAKSCDAPEYVSTVPDCFSPLQVAEHLALIWENQVSREAHFEARSAYLETHNFEYYGKRLLEILGIA